MLEKMFGKNLHTTLICASIHNGLFAAVLSTQCVQTRIKCFKSIRPCVEIDSATVMVATDFRCACICDVPSIFSHYNGGHDGAGEKSCSGLKQTAYEICDTIIVNAKLSFAGSQFFVFFLS